MRDLTVVLTDDAALFREALADVLGRAGFRVRAQAGDAAAARAAIAEHRPDLAVFDIRLPPTHTLEGLVAAAEIRETHPDTGVLVLSQHLETRLLRMLVRSSTRGVGYLLKERVTGIQDFVDAARRVATGGCAFDPEVVRALTRGDPLSRLSEREHEILSLIAQGRSNMAICEQLRLTKKTVESHVRSIMLRLDLQPQPDDHRRVLAVLEYLRPWSEEAYRLALPPPQA